MGVDSQIGNVVIGFGISVPAPEIAQRELGKGFGQIPGRQQVAGIAARAVAVAVGPYIVAPVRDFAPLVQPGFGFHTHSAAVGFPGVFVFAHPLQPDGRSRHRHCHQSGIGGGVVGPVVAVAARAGCTNQVDFFGFQAQHFGQRVPKRVDALTVRPDVQRSFLVQSHAARRTDGAVHLVRFEKAGFHRFSIRLIQCFDRSLLFDFLALRRNFPNVFCQILTTRQRWRVRPAGVFQSCLPGQYRLVLVGGYYGQKGTVDDRFQEIGDFLVECPLVERK